MPISVSSDPLKAHENACYQLIYAVECMSPAALRLVNEGDTKGYDAARYAVMEAYRLFDHATTQFLQAHEGVLG